MLALTYTLDVEAHGGDASHLRTEPPKPLSHSDADVSHNYFNPLQHEQGEEEEEEDSDEDEDEEGDNSDQDQDQDQDSRRGPLRSVLSMPPLPSALTDCRVHSRSQ